MFSRLDYCNSLLAGAPRVLLDQLSCVMRASARLTLGLSKFSHVAVITREKLHWLDFPARVVFKLCLTPFRCLHGLALSYLARSCIPVSSVPGRSHLRSAALGALVIPSSRLVTVGERAFVVTCPRAWNLLHLICGLLILAFKPSVRSLRLFFSILILSSSLTLRSSDSCLFFADHVLRSFYESM